MTLYDTLYAREAELHSLHSAPPSPTTPALPIVQHEPPLFDLSSSRASSVSVGTKLGGVERMKEVRREVSTDSESEDVVSGETRSDSKVLEQVIPMIKKADEEREETLRRFNETLEKALADKDATLRHAQHEHEETMRRLIQGHEETIRIMTHEREETNRKMVSDIASLVRKEREA